MATAKLAEPQFLGMPGPLLGRVGCPGPPSPPPPTATAHAPINARYLRVCSRSSAAISLRLCSRTSHQAPSPQPRRHLARKQRHRGRNVGCARIEPRQDEGRQGDERSASGKRVLRARPKPGDKEQEKHRRTMRDVLTGEKKAGSSALSVQASPPPIVNHSPSCPSQK